ncbi:MAG: hypothetical protein K2K30_01825 [Alistipes sp.]|nr:hypothetical protein [Alistipes sp.]MDE6623121.1 hypothetical protein [Alistipes sp.]
MLGFTPFKRHANKFNYIPRYYDPEKEAREQRRAELRGERAEDAEREYRPGQYIRTQRDARAARRDRDEGQGRMRIWKMLAAAAVVMLFISLVYPHLAALFLNTSRAKAPVATEEVGDFDPSAPITVVPNDYQE